MTNDKKKKSSRIARYATTSSTSKFVICYLSSVILMPYGYDQIRGAPVNLIAETEC